MGRDKNKFTKEEDQFIIDCVEELGTNSWAEVSKRIKTRTTRQVRERWFHYLSPAVNTTEWTEEEDKMLMRLVETMGNRWKGFECYFNQRTEVSIKNRYLVLTRLHRKKMAINLLKATRAPRKPKTKHKSLRADKPSLKRMDTNHVIFDHEPSFSLLAHEEGSLSEPSCDKLYPNSPFQLDADDSWAIN